MTAHEVGAGPEPAGAAGTGAGPRTGGSPDVAPTAWDHVRRWRPTRRSGAVALLVILALVALTMTRPSRSGYLDPVAVDPSGSRALATLLADQGVAVADVTTVAGAVAQARGATVLLTDALLPTPAMVEDLLSAGPARIVLVGAAPGMPAFDRLAAGAALAEPADEGALQPRCTLPAAVRAGDATLPGPRYDVRGWLPGGGTAATGDASDAACYDAPGAAGVALLPARAGRPDVVLLGSGNPLTNGGLDEQGNAALAMNLLGAHPDLVWWRPSPLDPALAGELPPNPLDLLPAWVATVVVQLLVASLLVAWWRGRRLGPVVVEPLPVVIPAGETTRGRARLLHSHHARGEAAAHLRAAARERLRVRMGLPLGVTPQRLAGALAARTGRRTAAVEQLLYGPEPTDDAALVRLEHDLGELVAGLGTLEGGRR
jgi:hypothetical protein